MANIKEKVNRLALSGVDLSELTDWPDSLKEDYLSIGTALIDLADAVLTVANQTAVPATASSPGIKGQIAIGGGFFYDCVAADTWERVATATWV